MYHKENHGCVSIEIKSQSSIKKMIIKKIKYLEFSVGPAADVEYSCSEMCVLLNCVYVVLCLNGVLANNLIETKLIETK